MVGSEHGCLSVRNKKSMVNNKEVDSHWISEPSGLISPEAESS